MNSEPLAPPPPSTSRKPRKWLRRLGWAAIWALSLLALLYAIEDWRGRRAWKAYVAACTAAGESLDPASLALTDVPEDQNFAASPIFRTLYDYEMVRNGKESFPLWKDKQRKEYLDGLQAYSPPTAAGNWRSGKRTDLEAWRSSLLKKPLDVSLAKDGDPAAAILSALEPLTPLMDEVAKAAELPYSRFPIRHEETVNAIRPHLSPMMSFGHLARLRAAARLATGNVDGAFEDTLLGFRLAEKMAGDQVLIGYLVSLSVEERAMVPLWEGLIAHHWNDQQLNALQQQLSRINHAQGFQNAMRAERLFGFAMVDSLRSDPGFYGATMIGLKEAGVHPPLSVLSAITMTIPQGWYDLNKVAMGRNYQGLMNVVDTEPPRFYPDRAEALAAEVDGDGALRHDFRLFFARLAMPALIGFPSKSAAAQGTVDLALVALALERHRLRYGTYPAALEAIDREFLGSRGIPQDCATGRPPHYVLNGDGTYTLYFEGWNGHDDGGEIAYRMNSKTAVDFNQGDWVWPQVAE
jgi:hypothetical protein